MIRDSIYVARSERLSVNYSSSGNQMKWKHGNIFVKLDCLGYESVSECLVSTLLSFTEISEKDYVKYYPCIIYEDEICLGNGCYSYDFVGEWKEISARVILEKSLMSLSIDYFTFLDVLYDYTGQYFKNYIDRILYVDSITRNDDRHFGNIVFLVKDGIFKSAPLFDHGAACMSDIFTYPMNEDLNSNFKRIYAKPFYTSFLRQIYPNQLLKIDYSNFVRSFHGEDEFEQRAMDTMILGLKCMEGISWQRI